MIKIDMEIPPKCEECPCCQPDAHFIQYICGITDESIMDYEDCDKILEERPDWCPMEAMEHETECTKC